MSALDTVIPQENICWAARLLVKQHGDFAPAMARRCVLDMERAGRAELAETWERVWHVTYQMIAASPEPSAGYLH